MILAVAAVTYLCCVQGFSPDSPRLRPCVEDEQLQNAPIISIIDDDESMRCAMKSLVTSLGFGLHVCIRRKVPAVAASGPYVLRDHRFANAGPERRRTAEIAVGAGSPHPYHLRDRFSRGATAGARHGGWCLGLPQQALRK